MKIIGISGLDRAVKFKQAEFPDLTVRQYRLIQGADSAAALVVDGQIIAAAAEERFTGDKHTNVFPLNAVKYCLEEGDLDIDDVDEIVHCFNYGPHANTLTNDDYSHRYFDGVYHPRNLIKSVSESFPSFPKNRISFIDHHLSHAASAYWSSGWNECLVVVVDGMGETNWATIFVARDGVLDAIAAQGGIHSFGLFYSIVTFHLGFDFNSDEYKVMGLAPYGDASRFHDFFEREVVLCDNGFCSIPSLGLNQTAIERDNYLATLEYLSEHLGFARAPDAPIEQIHRDIAASLQARCNSVLGHLCRHYGEKTGQRRIAVTGGVAQNCTTMGRIAKSGLFDEMYVGPGAGDDGAAIGAALHRASTHQSLRSSRPGMPFYGPGYSEQSVNQALRERTDAAVVKRFSSDEDACSDAASEIAQGRVLAWFHGRMEFGARALGNRSIVADPTDPSMRDRVNMMVKKRESFRPFAPAVLSEVANDWFVLSEGADHSFMTIIVDVRPQHRDRLPAVTHVDGSARAQTVSASDNPRFYKLISAVGKRTGVPMVLNTSFNVRGQPIVNTPGEAIDTFLRTELDYLYLENVKIGRAHDSSSSPQNKEMGES